MLSANWPLPTPLAALTIAAASMFLTVPVTASADDSNPAASGTQVNANSLSVQPAASDSAADTQAAAPSASSAAAINPADPNPPDIPGQVILGDGFVYQGGLRAGMFDGKGVKRWPTGDWVYGDFVQGKLDGDAIIHHADGGTLTGTFRHNAPWDAVEKDTNGNVVATYQGGVMRAVTQVAAPAGQGGGVTPAAQQVHSGTPVSNQ
ncbi:hypothetical protein [Paraburkholderia humisilvae]|uniref:MORN repeat protein n=1 Tax=Paraburkholderia humisilvae TaxID=627669 RepID=A0A6J5EKV2_9BURK|nr:hypothetical protein [Paraburkholderia humisilvae]CAB3766893.1 hypothetical protein LMG29542_05463 [Paraburkholderia humisilvae]